MSKRPFTVDALNNATFRVTTVLNNYQMTIDDPERAKRLQRQECQLCFYRNHLWGNDTVDCFCESCDKKQLADSFWKPRLCPECAERFHACKQCGADLELKARNVLERKRK